ncbi:P-loop NTPase fold protein [Chryseobacterium sp. MEBOG07]|uniref:KAP family P-loop NTPase fold protein n=1 Tax=Chryseobacterium sp. MEBOG07 TaxID=2879939 RepID=UPI001F15EF49|nr:P-loop NTPase fold protein [Chryseobacterium sp. MEBOG07]UKB78635.1 KAP family NTPase [Chryseobacterium sp. MEBOG07]
MNIYTDKPATLQSEDYFQRYDFSKRIASIVAKPVIDKSLIIGLYGRWGEGKTTVMNFIQQELPKETIVVNFNPWLFSDEQHLLKSFFTSISEALGASDKTKKEKIGELLSDYGGAIGSVTQFMGFSTDGLEKLGNKLKSTSTEELKKRIDELIIQSQKNIVVFVDDIDRLDISEVQYVFKLVKLVGDFPRTSYILSFDEEMVSAALSPKYGGDSKSAGYNFLEKIIQIPIKIPKASKKALSKYTLYLLNKVLDEISIDLNKGESNDFLEVFNNAFLPVMDNPRLGIRFANTLSFSLPLLNGEVNISDLMIIEGLKIFYPSLYDFVRNNGHLFLERTDRDSYSGYKDKKQRQDEIKKEISQAIDIYDEKKQKVVIGMLEQLFPQLKIIYSNSGYADDIYTRWTKAKKICSDKYFERYFSYSVQEGDIPDKYFENLIQNFEEDTIEQIVIKLNNTIDIYAASDLIQKLRMQEEALTEIQANNLSLALIEFGHTLPQEQEIYFSTTYTQSAILITKLVRNQSKKNQLSLLLKLFSVCKSLSYSMEIHYWLMFQEEKDSKNAILSEKDKLKIKELLISNFKNAITDENFFTLLSDGNLCRILTWMVGSSKYKRPLQIFWNKHLKKKNNPEFALKLLKVFTPTIQMTSSADDILHIYKSGFPQSNFEAIRDVVDVKLLHENLIKSKGMNLSEIDPSTVSNQDPINDETLISVFQWYINNRLIEKPDSITKF